MLHHPIKAGTTDQSVYLRIVDATDGTPETGVVYNTSGIDLWYRRTGGAKVSITEASLLALTDAHSDGGFLHVGDGLYRLDLPDAAVAAGATSVLVGGTVTGMVVVETLVPLVAYDGQDTVRLGLTALPNAAAGASGGLPTVDSANDVGIQTGLKKNQAWNNFTFLMVDASNNPATGLTVTATRSIDGSAFGAGTLGAVTEISDGYYKLNIPAADLNGDTVTLKFAASGAKTYGVTLRLEP